MTGHEQEFMESRAIVRAAMSDLITYGLSALSGWLQRNTANEPVDYGDPRIIDHDDDTDYDERTEIVDAAGQLGVGVGASADEVRAAFRRAIKAEMANDSGFHDHGGDSTDPRAQRLITAKNLLIENARKEAGHASVAV